MHAEVGLSLGANVGDRLAALREARRRIVALPGVRLVAQAPVYETEPIGVGPAYQDVSFLNTVLIVVGPGTPHDWYAALQVIEKDLGRRRSLDRNEPRVIDIDIVYVGDAEVESGGLVVPHPRWQRRRFVLQPLADVRPRLILPGADRSVAEILRALPGPERVELLLKDW